MGFSFIRKTASTGSSATGALVGANSLQPLSTYLGQFDINYIVFKNVEIFKNYFFQIKKILWREMVNI